MWKHIYVKLFHNVVITFGRMGLDSYWIVTQVYWVFRIYKYSSAFRNTKRQERVGLYLSSCFKSFTLLSFPFPNMSTDSCTAPRSSFLTQTSMFLINYLFCLEFILGMGKWEGDDRFNIGHTEFETPRSGYVVSWIRTYSQVWSSDKRPGTQMYISGSLVKRQ